MSQIPCTCSAGKQTITVHRGVDVSKVELDCMNCGGKGYRTTAEQRLVEAMNAMWCRCETPGEPIYHPDEPGGLKHHWTCGTCGKVTQVG